MTTVPESAHTVHFDTTWTTAVRRVSELAQARLPVALHGRVERATGLVLARASGSRGGWPHLPGARQRWPAVVLCQRQSCPCEDHQRAPEHLCKHRLAAGIYLRASELLREGLPPVGAGPL